METQFKFRPIAYSWVALHPQPIGVIQFIGGAFFGSFPTLFYRYLLQKLFDQGYTIIALPFRFTFRHWSVALGLLKNSSQLRAEILAEAKRLGYDYHLYEEEPTAEKPNYFWLAHSVGCKYIALLELLSDLEDKTVEEILGDCVGSDQAQEIQQQLEGVDLKDISLKNQPSVLLAPVIAGIESAIPVAFVAELVKKLGLDVKPTVEQTYCLIKNSRLFNLIALMVFGKDDIAKKAGTVDWMLKNLQPVAVAQVPERSHLAPLGFRQGDTQVAGETIRLLSLMSDRLQAIFAQPSPEPTGVEAPEVSEVTS
jgi:hypothetical protein